MGSSEKDMGCNYTGDGMSLTGIKGEGHYDNIAHWTRFTMAKIRLFVQKNWAILLIAGLYSIWGLAFIYHSSHVGSDGRLYFVLFDDAMISMRYAWNLAHGNGLVWNPGEYVEGYTNLLMTLLMALASSIFEKRYAVLAIQLTGILFAFGTALFTLKIFHTFKASRAFAGYLLLAAILLYYPLNYWSLMGMETGMLAFLLSAGVLCSILYTEKSDNKYIWLMTLCFGLAFLTRNDSLLFAALAFTYLFRKLKHKNDQVRFLLTAGIVYILFVLGQTMFRFFYYGEIVPNTYTLKLTGMPLAERLKNGWGFIQPFFKETSLVLLFAFIGSFLNFSSKKLYLFEIFLISVLYQIYVGGDPWDYWRIMAPTMPFLFILFFEGCMDILGFIPKLSQSLASIVLLFVLIVTGVYFMDSRFLRQMSLLDLPYDNRAAQKHINIAIAINELTDQGATIGVFWAGTIPYYTDRVAIDFLGKSDPYIAQLPPDLSGEMGWLGMNSVPGHNKYDLNYSIKQLLPTYVQEFEVGSQDINTWGAEHYVNVKYKGIRLYLLKDSPHVYWDKAKRHK
jgi:hypothetical protein